MALNCDPAAVAKASACFCLPANASRGAWLWLLCQWANASVAPVFPVVSEVVILPDGAGGFWRVLVDILGDVYTQTDPGPQTPDVILADGGGGFWKLIASVAGDRYGVSNAGPATVAPVILDSNLVAWTLTVDALGDITATA